MAKIVAEVEAGIIIEVVFKIADIVLEVVLKTPKIIA